MKRSLLLTLALATGAVCAHASSLEVVQSVPVETTLAVPGVRHAQDVWVEMINSATQSIDIEQFYIANQDGESLEPVLKAIEAASRRGVRVRTLVDTKMYKTYPESVERLGRLAGAEARQADFSQYGGIQHGKIFVVDGKLAFVGSQNFDWKALSHIHEIGLRIEDTRLVGDLSRIFEADWAQAGSRAPQTATRAQTAADAAGVAKIVASPAKANPAGIPDSIGAILELLSSAQESIRVQVMDYATSSYGGGNSKPWTVLEDALSAAAKRGVQVQLMLDVAHAKSASKDLRRLAAVENVEIRTVTIPAWSGGKLDYARLVHSKYVVVDGGLRSWVGTENWSRGYFMSCRNMGLVISDRAVGDTLNQVYSRVWDSRYSKKLKP